MNLRELLAKSGQFPAGFSGEMPIKIELNGVVDDLVATEAYFVPASEEYPAALHIVVSAPNDNLPSSAMMDDHGTFD